MLFKDQILHDFLELGVNDPYRNTITRKGCCFYVLCKVFEYTCHNKQEEHKT